MIKKIVILLVTAFFLISCSLLNGILKTAEPQVIVVTATPEVVVLPTTEPTAQESVPVTLGRTQAITKPVSANLTEIFGPTANSLEKNDTAHVPEYCAGVTVKDFKAEVTFTSIPSLDTYENSFGFFFRHLEDNDELRLVIARGTFELIEEKGEGRKIISGQLDMDIDPRGTNHLELYAIGDTGYFYLNGYKIYTLDLSSRSDAGDVCVIAGDYNGDIFGAITVFQDFSVWQLDPQ